MRLKTKESAVVGIEPHLESEEILGNPLKFYFYKKFGPELGRRLGEICLLTSINI